MNKMFWKKNGSTVLGVAGAAGVIGTTVLAVKATPKAMRLLEKAKEEKGENLTKLEVIKVAGPAYIPTVLVGAGAIACILGANVLNKKQQAYLMSAYALVDGSFKEYKTKVGELYGEDADERINDEIAKDKYKANPVAVANDKKLYYDAYSKQYFEATGEDVLRAQAGLNKLIAINTGACLNEWYEQIGLEPTMEGNELGWSNGILESMYWTNWVDFKHSEKAMDDGTKYIEIYMLQEPVIDYAYY